MTQYKDEARRQRYIKRHEENESKFWNKSGIDTPRFWALLLWNKPTMIESYDDIKKRIFKIYFPNKWRNLYYIRC